MVLYRCGYVTIHHKWAVKLTKLLLRYLFSSLSNNGKQKKRPHQILILSIISARNRILLYIKWKLIFQGFCFSNKQQKSGCAEFTAHLWWMVTWLCMVTGKFGHKSNRPQSILPKTNSATNQFGHKPIRVIRRFCHSVILMKCEINDLGNGLFSDNVFYH